MGFNWHPLFRNSPAIPKPATSSWKKTRNWKADDTLLLRAVHTNTVNNTTPIVAGTVGKELKFDFRLAEIPQSGLFTILKFIFGLVVLSRSCRRIQYSAPLVR